MATGTPSPELVESFDPAMLVMCRQALDRTRDSAEQLLRDGMLRPSAARDGSASWTQVAANGLEEDYLPRHDALWQAYWRLHCLQVVRLETGERLFEGRRVSLHIEK